MVAKLSILFIILRYFSTVCITFILTVYCYYNLNFLRNNIPNISKTSNFVSDFVYVYFKYLLFLINISNTVAPKMLLRPRDTLQNVEDMKIIVKCKKVILTKIFYLKNLVVSSYHAKQISTLLVVECPIFFNYVLQIGYCTFQ